MAKVWIRRLVAVRHKCHGKTTFTSLEILQIQDNVRIFFVFADNLLSWHSLWSLIQTMSEIRIGNKLMQCFNIADKSKWLFLLTEP